jgi:hypothetical protein
MSRWRLRIRSTAILMMPLPAFIDTPLPTHQRGAHGNDPKLNSA